MINPLHQLKWMACIVMCMANAPTLASTPWRVTTTLQGIDLEYSESASRDRLSGWGFLAAANYFEDFDITVGYSRRVVAFKSTDSTDETDWYLSGRANRFFDKTGGRVSLRADTHRIQDVNAAMKDNISVWYLQPSYLNAKQTFYADVGYANSSYHSDNTALDDLAVTQWTPTIGFWLGPHHGLQTRGYFIAHTHSDRMMQMRATEAIEIKWTYRMTMTEVSEPESVIVSVLTGKRMFAVDPDSLDVFSLSDIQQNAYALSLRWRVTDTSFVLATVGRQDFESVNSMSDYYGKFLHISIRTTW